jgi:hypothetical protein
MLSRASAGPFQITLAARHAHPEAAQKQSEQLQALA